MSPNHLRTHLQLCKFRPAIICELSLEEGLCQRSRYEGRHRSLIQMQYLEFFPKIV